MARKMLSDGELNKAAAAGEEATTETHYDFDLFVIGAGSGGVRAARFSANNGAKVTFTATVLWLHSYVVCVFDALVIDMVLLLFWI